MRQQFPAGRWYISVSHHRRLYSESCRTAVRHLNLSALRVVFNFSLRNVSMAVPAAARLLRLCVRIPPGAWMSVWCECCVLSGRGLCDELITRPEESYRLWCVVVFDLETSWMRRPWLTGGLLHQIKRNVRLLSWLVNSVLKDFEL